MPNRSAPGRARWRLRTSAMGCVTAVLALTMSACAGAGGGGGDAGGVTTVNVATVSNPQMKDIQKLTGEFEKTHPNIKINYVQLPENELRDRVTQDVATGSGQFDVATIGTYETPLWAKNGWLTNLNGYASQGDYDVADFVPTVRDALTFQGGLYAVPFYGESSFLMYRKDLFQQAGLTMPEQPTWDQVTDLARRLNDPASGRAGICLRGEPGWGELLAPLDTVINTFGGQWFDQQWNAHLTDPATEQAVKSYVDLVRTDGEPGAPNAGFDECLNQFGQGKAAMWYDSTSAGGSLEDPASSQVAGKVGYVKAPVQRTQNSGWLWAWSFAIPQTAKHKDAAWQFMSWATSKQYQTTVGQQLGWQRVPPGNRLSNYQIPQYRQEPFAQPTLDGLASANLKQPGLFPQPWSGVQYVQIPEFQDLGTKVSQEISAAIAGHQTVEEALAKSQQYAEQAAREGGYHK